MRLRLIVVLFAVGVWSGPASSAPATCSFEPASGLLLVTLQGDRTSLTATSTGAIELDGTPCGAASKTSTARIVVTELPGDDDYLTLNGRFAPGRNDAPDPGRPEIEIEVGFTSFYDLLIIRGAPADDVWVFTAAGINLNGDGDEDLSGPTDGRLRLQSLKGNDLIDASAYTGGCSLHMLGGEGNDTITGSAGNDKIRGHEGNDILAGGAGDDSLDDGPGNDRVSGGPGDDAMYGLEAAANGADDFRGNAGTDVVAYRQRQQGLTVTLDGVADDGEPGEGDNVRPDVEDIVGGAGDDVLVGSAAANHLEGIGGRNELYGGAGDDVLDGRGGQSPGSLLVGDDGNDIFWGSPGEDFFDGGAGDDVFDNLDPSADTVDCGAGIDDPEPDALDTFIACENI